MRLLFFELALMLELLFLAVPAFACTCSGLHGTNAWDTVKLEADSAAAIFEGTPVQFQLHWDALNAKTGNFISADSAGPHSGSPRMAVTFRVTKVYKGELGTGVQVKTGLGGGDCGARFLPGVTYLVYGTGPKMSNLSVGMCSPGGWIGDEVVATEVRYLTHQRPTQAELRPWKPLWMLSKAEEENRQRHAEETRKRYSELTGVICGTVVQDGGAKSEAGRISFLSSLVFSPFDHPAVSMKEDGSFCSDRLGPGRYYIFFEHVSEAKYSALYYPGVNERKDALPANVVAAQTTHLNFKVPLQKTYSVRCLLSTNDKSQLSGNDVQIVLFRSDGTNWYRGAVNFEGFWPLPKTKYFTFEQVPPGHYVAFASVFGNGWLTRKVDVDVVTHSKLIFLDVVRKN